MAYTKYSLTPGSNTAAPPDGAPEGMLPSAVNDTMRDMMAQIRDCGDGIRGGTYTMTAPVITGGSITGSTVNNAVIGGTTRAAGSFTTVTTTNDASISGLTVGKGGGAGATNTAIGLNALATNSAGAYLTAVGAQSARYTTGDGVTAMGYSALNSNTSGTNSVAIGAFALTQNTTASDNVAVGYQALYSTVTGNACTAVGTGALYSNTAAENSAFGRSALNANTTGTNNTALGQACLAGNTTGNYNAAGGRASLFSNTTGASNTAFGTDALRLNTTASNNTAVGYQAGYSNTVGAGCTFIGQGAGYTSAGSANTCVGQNTGYSLTTGYRNTFVGCSNQVTGAAGGLVTTGNNNTIIGGYTGNQGGLDIRTASNYIVLSDGDGNPRQIINGSGFVMIGGRTSVPYSETLSIGTAGQQGIHINDSTSASSINYQYFTKGAGPTNVGAIYYNGSTMAYQTTSDYRLKENIAPITNALATVALLKPSAYRWKESQSEDTGFIAHELQEVFPQAVSGQKDAVDANGNPVYQGIDTSFLVATLTAAIQELKAEVDSLKQQLGK